MSILKQKAICLGGVLKSVHIYKKILGSHGVVSGSLGGLEGSGLPGQWIW